MAKDKEIKLGQTVKDKITGYEGIATSRTIFMEGCDRIGVTSRELKKGNPQDSISFDEYDLDIIDNGIIEKLVNGEKKEEKPKSKRTGARIPYRDR